ncbi:PREDICTED: F-box/FBD/LRR-repeat protein At2g26030 [Camelina sativa]|uniref:F-box/FBD/LRR-repeat protein At2g26030 n=1 Tax=Camelina sativa TaxID=90675 RepID=A0ABM1RBL9_CAMSA|nr:PREDICTED: F-box/FBD/LRR-repeat protein At2g26030 [Camelina sativa]
MEKLISGCPVLEEFALALPYDYHERQKNVSSLRVKSQTLKSFIFSFDTNYTDTVFAFEIDAPQLKYMYFSDDQSDRIVLKNLTSLSMIEIGSDFHVDRGSTSYRERRNAIRDFLNGISSVRHMIISESTLKVLFHYSKLGRIRKFDNVTRLQAAIYSNMLELFPAFLESFPNLKNLILDLIVVTREIKLNGVPQCMVLNLECVEIKLKDVMVEEPVKTLVRYFLENSVVLKKLILRFKESSEAMKVYARAKKASSRAKKVSDIFKELSTFTKLSPRCEIITIDLGIFCYE